jgi:hypothetical protein
MTDDCSQHRSPFWTGAASPGLVCGIVQALSRFAKPTMACSCTTRQSPTMMC